MDREHALELMNTHITNKNLRKHVLAVEAVMIHLARRLGEDEKTWGLVGLLHDLDYEQTLNDPDNHTLITVEMLKKYDLPSSVSNAVLAHNNKAPIESKLEKSIYCADPVTGMIVACVLIHPDKSLDSINADFVTRRMGEKRFAASVNRDAIKSCSTLGLSLTEFLTLSLEAMRGIRKDLGL